jgi:dihydroorotate dehydrogenase electron transfer subunit
MMPKRVQDFIIVENRQIKRDFFVLELSSSEIVPGILPGQFVQARVDGSPATFLRRPLSIHDIDYSRNTMKLLIQVVGAGTDTLSKLKPGDSLNLVYPLGNSFSFPQKGDKIVLIVGGCGIAPLLYLAKSLNQDDHQPDILIGFRNSDRIIENDEYKKYGDVYITTEDGSEGEKGYVTDHSILRTKRYDRVYCCGPDSMMKAVARYSVANKIYCEVSLENLMACGIGICLCCVVRTTRGNVCTCSEGPVFNINELKW